MKSNKNSFQIKKILCPTDLSTESAVAIEYAAGLADKLKAGIYMCHHTSPPGNGDFQDAMTELKSFEKQVNNSLLKRGFSQNQQKFLPDCDGRYSKTAECVAAQARHLSANLMVLSARHRLLWAPFFGSTLERIVRSSPCPVLILPLKFQMLKTKAAARFRGIPQKILLNYDHHQWAQFEHTLNFALDLADAFEAELHLINIFPPAEYGGTEVSPTIEGRTLAHRLFDEKVDNIRADHPHLRVITANRYGSRHKMLAAYAKSKRIDLIFSSAGKEMFYIEYLFPVRLRRLLENTEVPVIVMPSSSESGLKGNKNFQTVKNISHIV